MHQKPIVLSPAASKGCIALFVLFVCSILSCFLAPPFLSIVVTLVGEISVYTQAETTQATVIDVIATNKSCILRIPCTHFMAEVVFNTPTQAEQVNALLDMGHVLGYNQPISKADYPPGTTFTIRYNPLKLGQVSYDSLWGIFKMEDLLPPLFILLTFMFMIGYRINFYVNLVTSRLGSRRDDDWRA